MIKYICKRLITTIIILISFLFLILVKNIIVNPMLVKGYYNETNEIYSNSLKLDINDYYNDNILYDQPEYPSATIIYNFNKGIYYIGANLSISSGNSSYTGTIQRYNNGSTSDNNGGIVRTYQRFYNSGFNYYQIEVVIPGTYRIETFYTSIDNNIFVEDIMISKEQPTEYHDPFQFGYIISNTNSNNFTINFIDNYNNDNVYTLKNNSTIYLPFQYRDNNIVTFSYNVEYDNNNTNIFNNEIIFTPVFKGQRKDNNSNNLISNYTYTYNYLYYKNLTFSNLQDVNLSDVIELNYLSNNYDAQSLTNLTVYRSLNIISDYTSDIKQTNFIDKEIYFNGNNSIYKFILKINMFNEINGVLYSISFDSINLGVKNSMTSSSYETNTDNDLEIYRSCDNFFTDMPCYASNAATYVIYNLPLISPLIQLTMGMVSVMNNIVVMIKWYEGLGILFSLFIFILMIRVIIMLLKGSNDDRGNKK